jgi:hypothetical protein
LQLRKTYIDRCVLIAEFCVALERESTKSEVAYLLDRSYYRFILESELIQPSLVFCKDKLGDESKEEKTLESYILEVFNPTLAFREGT